jgi:M6 family metalloprotease-like protein
MLFAAPLRMLPLSFEQPDGSTVKMFATGDEFHNWLHDADDYTIVKDDAGWYVYARTEGDGVAPTDLIVGRSTPNQRNLVPGINLSRERIAAKYDRYKDSMRDYSNARSPHTGQFNNIVIFIRFADDPNFTSPITYYNNIFNATENNANSMKNYFLAASYEQLNVDTTFYPAPNGTTVVSYVDTQPRNYFRIYSGSNPIGYPADDDGERANREMQMLARAVAAVGNQIPADLVIDGDSDGYVDNTCFIIQGSPDGWAELLWPHRWVLYGVTATIHGSRVWDFNFQLDNSLSSSGASVLAHEMFHSLGAPDLYRYSNNNITPIGSWDLMANNANPPQHMSAWMKYRYGQWLPAPPTITTSGTYTLSPLASSATNNIYRVASWKTSEFYVLEYRKPGVFYDDNLPGTGLLVYRLDTREQGNAQGPPDELYIYRPGANNTNTNGSLGSAAFSAQSGRTAINERTVPSGFLGNNVAGGLNIYNIGIAGETISFSINISDIQLITPAGGETWFFGSNKEITWKAKTTTGNVKIEFTPDMGSIWNVIVASTPNDGSFIWTGIPYLNSQQCLIRTTLLSNNHTDISASPFTVLSFLETPVAVYPPHQSVSAPTNPAITWETVPGAASYQFQLSTDPEFDTYLVDVFGHVGNVYNANNLSPYTTYYWRVASIADIGISPFCDTRSFTTGEITEIPGIPLLSSPANYAINVSLTPTFVWTAANLALRYRLQIAMDPYFSSLVSDVSGIDQTTYTSELLPANTALYWRVASANDFGNSLFSVSRRFTTRISTASEDDLIPMWQNELMPNYPNPFNPHTTISFSLKDSSKPVSLNIYNTRGQLVRKLFNGIPPSHELSIVWDGNDDNNKPVSSGVYLYRLDSPEFRETRKMLLSK